MASYIILFFETKPDTWHTFKPHYNDIMMSVMASPASRLFTQRFIQDADQRKLQSSASLDFVTGIHRWLVNSPHKGPVTRKMFPLDDVIMKYAFSRPANWSYPFPQGIVSIYWSQSTVKYTSLFMHLYIWQMLLVQISSIYWASDRYRCTGSTPVLNNDLLV